MVDATIAGKSVYQTLEASVRQAQGEVDHHDARMKTSAQEARELVTQRGEALLELAHHYLPEMSRQTIAGTFREIREELLTVLEDKRHRQKQLQQELEKVETDILRRQVELDQVTERLDEKVAQRETLEAVVTERLKGHASFQQLSGRALEAEQELGRNEQRVTEIDHEAEEKLPSYEKSRLFQYLHQRGYGTPGDDLQGRKWGLTKRLDRWVARLIDYARARRGYDFLRTTPELMKAEVGRRRAEFDALMEQVEAIEDEISDVVGLTDVLSEGDRLGDERDVMVESLERLTETKAGNQKEMLMLESSQGEYYAHAIDRLKQFLASLDEARLAERARRTPEPEDDDLVEEITGLGNQLQRNREQREAAAQDRSSWGERLSGLQQVLLQFRSAEFDSSRSLFPSGFRVDSHLGRYLEGRESVQHLWNVIRQHQQFTPTWHEQQGGFGQGINSELSYVLLRTLAEVAGAAMQGAATRGMERRGPIRRRRRIEVGRPRFPRRGFTNGRGF